MAAAVQSAAMGGLRIVGPRLRFRLLGSGELGTGLLLCGALWVAGLLSGCASSTARDLTTNSDLYRSPTYRAQVPPQKSVFVAPLRDDRKEPIKRITKGFAAATFTTDREWDRAPVLMIDEIIRNELQRSGVGGQVVEDLGQADLLIEPRLIAFHGAILRFVDAVGVYGEAGLEIVIKGAPDADGNRPVLLTKQFAKLAPGPRRLTYRDPMPDMARRFTGMALHQTVDAALRAIHLVSARGSLQTTSQPASQAASQPTGPNGQ